MTKNEQAQLAQMIEQMKTEFATALREQLQPLVLEINALQQRSSNFAARVNAANKVYRNEIASLRDQVAALTPAPKTKAPVRSPRCTGADWNAAMAVLKLNHPGQTYFNRDDVIATVERLKPEAAHVEASAPMEQAEEEEDVTL